NTLSSFEPETLSSVLTIDQEARRVAEASCRTIMGSRRVVVG
ncbi:MAG TPA: hypothetical protein PLN52_08325, partial [Opitutaceae bacterium]|nr:hypothetical protein [Opitutaceae bacterium]